jgi:hypothetical protein
MEGPQRHRQSRQERVRLDAGVVPGAASVAGNRLTARMPRGPPRPRRRREAEPTEQPRAGPVQGVQSEGASRR